MAELVAIGDGNGAVDTGHLCDTTTTTDQCSSKVFVGGVGVVRQGDHNASHDLPCGSDCCAPHTVALSLYSSRVFSEGLGIGRKSDSYGGESITSAGQGRVMAG